MTMQTELAKVASGELPFAVFARRTARRWYGLAHSLLGRYDVPAGIDADDVCQELLLACWCAIPKWDRKRGQIEPYVVFTATRAARRWINKQRGVSGCAREHDQSRYPLTADCLTYSEHLSFNDHYLVEPMQERVEHARTTVQHKMCLMKTERSRIALGALIAAGSIDVAARLLYANRATRLVFGLGSFGQTRRMVERVVCKAARAGEVE